MQVMLDFSPAGIGSLHGGQVGLQNQSPIPKGWKFYCSVVQDVSLSSKILKIPLFPNRKEVELLLTKYVE